MTYEIGQYFTDNTNENIKIVILNIDFSNKKLICKRFYKNSYYPELVYIFPEKNLQNLIYHPLRKTVIQEILK